ncbi:MAG TPA: DNA topoisomerase 3 [Gaiellaceae bacterium]|nr:DNA topoisomerase 3 [Gaiellaceae bacterium]
MGKTLIIAEKPSVGRDLASALPGPFARRKLEDIQPKRKRAKASADPETPEAAVEAAKSTTRSRTREEAVFLESDDYVITWAVGHLVQLAEPEDYDEKWKRWRMADLPIVPGEFKLVPRDAKSKKQLKLIETLLLREDVDDIINACDAGREGELIFAYVYESVFGASAASGNGPKPVQRLWISSLTKQAIREGFERLRPGEQLRDLEAAARSRSEADWLVGMNATRAATIRGRAWVGGVVSLGRVQTPTLAMIVKREREIQAFVAEPYRLVHATFDPRYTGMWFEGDETRIFGDLARAEQIVAKVTGKDGVVESVERKEQSERAPLLYDLTALQRDANRRYSFSARRTLQAAQSLYEGKKAITYPRTSSRYLSGDMASQLKPTAETLRPIADYTVAAEYVLSLEQLPLARVVNDAKVDDHHAIIPTDIDHDVEDFTPDERRVFDLIARRFLAVFHPPARYARTTVITAVEEEHFRTRGKVTLEPGWRSVYGVEADADKQSEDEEAEGGEMPALEQGQIVRCASAEFEDKMTKPPPRYTEATLLSAMETAGKLVDDEELREAMKDSGLGTPATRAETIETLIRREYIERVGRDLQATPKGVQVITMLEEHKLTSPELTGDWEHKLSEIEHGRGDRRAFMDGIARFAKETVDQIAALDKEKLRPERAELGPCPRCGAETGEIIRENSKAYGCTSWKSREETGCGFVVWKRVAGRTLTPEIARQLIEERRTREVLSGFRSRGGKPFRARLVLNDEDKIEFEFPVRAQSKAPAAAE